MSRAGMLIGLGVAAALALANFAAAQDDQDAAAWSRQAARGAFELCRVDAPDAGKVAEQGEVWGWPEFVPYLEHPVGYERTAGGESRRTLTVGDQTSYVELTVQSGEVKSAAPAQVRYFRCEVAANQPVNQTLAAYFTARYGRPSVVTGRSTVWLAGATPVAGAAASDDAALAPVIAGPVGAKVTRVELSHERGLDRAKLSFFEKTAG